MSKYCPILKENVIYQYCTDCDDKPCKHILKEENAYERKKIFEMDNNIHSDTNDRCR